MRSSKSQRAEVTKIAGSHRDPPTRSQSRVLTYDTINEKMKECKYDVRGEIYLAAVKRVQEGKEVIFTNVGNPQALGQVPLTYNRQVMSLMLAPFLMEHPNVSAMFPADVIARAKLYLKHIKVNKFIMKFIFLK